MVDNVYMGVHIFLLQSPYISQYTPQERNESYEGDRSQIPSNFCLPHQTIKTIEMLRRRGSLRQDLILAEAPLGSYLGDFQCLPESEKLKLKMAWGPGGD